MKILQVIPYFVPAWDFGGPLPVCYELSKQLVKRGHQVTVWTTDALDARSRIAQRKETIDGIQVRRFRNLSNGFACRYNISSPIGMALAADEIKGYDIIHIHEYRVLQNAPIRGHAKKHGVPYILHAHGSLTTFFQKGWQKRIFDKLWGYRILRDAAKVIALTQTEAEQCKSMGVSSDKIEIVPNGIDLSEFENLPQRGQFRKKYGLDDAQKVVLYLARIHKIKGPDLLAKAFAELPKGLGGAKLVIAGPDDGYLAALKQLIRELKIEEEVMFTGPLYGRDKLEAYVDADVYVLPSGYEIFGITALEACACGTPVIVTDRCGIADVIHNQAGLVVPYDKDQLTKAILHMLADDKPRREFGEKGKLLVREKFNWHKIAQLVESVYLSCLASRS